jgi:hypothetical protein
MEKQFCFALVPMLSNRGNRNTIAIEAYWQTSYLKPESSKK